MIYTAHIYLPLPFSTHRLMIYTAHIYLPLPFSTHKEADDIHCTYIPIPTILHSQGAQTADTLHIPTLPILTHKEPRLMAHCTCLPLPFSLTENTRLSYQLFYSHTPLLRRVSPAEPSSQTMPYPYGFSSKIRL